MTDAPYATVHKPRPNSWDFTPDPSRYGNRARQWRRFKREAIGSGGTALAVICLVSFAFWMAGRW